MRIYKFVTLQLMPGASIRYQSFNGWSVHLDEVFPSGGVLRRTVGQLERIHGKMWAVDLPEAAFYKITDEGFEAAKAICRDRLLESFPDHVQAARPRNARSPA